MAPGGLPLPLLTPTFNSSTHDINFQLYNSHDRKNSWMNSSAVWSLCIICLFGGYLKGKLDKTTVLHHQFLGVKCSGVLSVYLNGHGRTEIRRGKRKYPERMLVHGTMNQKGEKQYLGFSEHSQVCNCNCYHILHMFTES